MSQARTSKFYLDNFSPSKITLARELRGLSKKALAEKIQKTPSAVTQIENGTLKPDVDTFTSIAMALSVRPSFFSDVSVTPDASLTECNFRSKRAATQGLKKQSIAYGRIVVQLFEFLEGLGVSFPTANIPKYNDVPLTKLDRIAGSVRDHWNLGVSPLPGLMNLLEEHGVFIILLDANSSNLDAYSTYIDGRPCIMVDYNKSASRQQFDLAHELGHLVLHEDSEANLVNKEREANWFGGSFLAPAELFRQECPRRWHYSAYLELKQRWHMSIQACMYRAKQLNIMTDSSYRWGMKQISMRNERINEGGEFEKTKPVLLAQALDLVKDEVSIPQLSEELGLNSAELISLLEVQQVPASVVEALSPKLKQQSKIVSIRRQ
ncbi:ImmA/IrrE family metallo-endopeptidase [Pseudodesulfovibrio thermohalotolerans]|uniref:ImmA/IrrE family metallo-endopeptidase n=1 Tax=Pseudodesulfovibrio thermohalotolerans TaxID=2880651 RepID=UPI0024435D2D|nr:ImmA/IrrE family metallo-endopeptidase [Pseudodesulfovibrio thermohalotolerans]WFS63414.1 ImmA/IrrE family metallo-endopeptidase [Pseudodesulfovibrio thermohalotolerans]